MVRVIVTEQADKQFQELPRTIRARITRMCGRLESWPLVMGVKGLRGNLAGKYRMRTGDFRLQFSVAKRPRRVGDLETIETVVVVEKVGHRSRFYE